MRGGRVAVLAGVAGELLAAQLAGGPALVEGVLEHVPAVAGLLDPLPDVVAHVQSSLAFAQLGCPRITSGGCAPSETTSRPPTCPRESPGSARNRRRCRSLTAAGPGARPLPRLRPAQQRPDPPLPGRVGPPLPRRRAADDRRPGAPLPVRRRPRGGRRGPRAARRRVPGRDRRRARPLALLRLRGLAQPLPLGPGRRPDAGSTSARANTPGPRRRSRPSCASSTRCASCRRRWRRCAPTDAPGRAGDGAEPRALPGRLLGAALDRGRGRRGARRPLRGGRRLRDGRGRGRGRGRARRRGRGAGRGRRRRPSTPSPSTPATRATSSSCAPPPACGSGRSASPPACPSLIGTPAGDQPSDRRRSHDQQAGLRQASRSTDAERSRAPSTSTPSASRPG